MNSRLFTSSGGIPSCGSPFALRLLHRIVLPRPTVVVRRLPHGCTRALVLGRVRCRSTGEHWRACAEARGPQLFGMIRSLLLRRFGLDQFGVEDGKNCPPLARSRVSSVSLLLGTVRGTVCASLRPPH